MNAEDRADIAAAIDEEGGTATITRANRTENRTTSKVTEGAPTVISCRAVIGRIKISADGRTRFQSVASTVTELKVGDKFAMGGVTYLIDSVDRIAPDGGTPVIFQGMLK